MAGNIFMTLVNMMGFTEGLVAIAEEPEAVKGLFQAVADFEDEKLKLSMAAYKPDVVIIGDDVATIKDLFISPKAYKELLAPFHAQLAKTALENGAIVEMHCCGKCDALVEQWVEMGITAWQPAQPVNDLLGIKEKYAGKFVINGAWDTKGPGGMSGASEEVVRQSVRDTIDTYAPGGGFVFWDGALTGGDFQKFEWTADEAKKYGKSFFEAKQA